MKCLVTGATGFVGGHLCERLATDGHTVYALARKTSRKKVLKRSGAKIVIGDLDSAGVFTELAGEIDTVFHLAAITKALRPNDFFNINTVGTRNLLRGLRRGAFRGHVVYLSSLAAAGPVRDARSRRKEEDDEEPVSDYGESKLAAEDILRQHLANGCTYTILRPGAIYGPREHEIYEVLKIMQRAHIAFRLGGGVYSQFTHVHDVVDALVLAGRNPAGRGRLYNINNDPVWSLDDIVDLASRHLGHTVYTIPIPVLLARGLANTVDFVGRLRRKSVSPLTRDKLHELEARYWAGDAARAERELGWTSKWEFPRGLEETIAWYRRKGWLR